MAKKYTRIWNLVNDTCKGSPKKSKEKYYKSMLTKLRKWSKDNNIDKEKLIKKVLSTVGKKCRYCDTIMSVKKGNSSMSLDHIIPKHRGGDKSLDNIQFICYRCNKRKGVLTDKQYKNLIKFLNSDNEFDKEARDYVLKQLTMSIF